jgi:hypothetical protein
LSLLLLPNHVTIKESLYRNARSSSHLLSCADMCADLWLLLQYDATLHWRQVTRAYARSAHSGRSQIRVSSTHKLSCSGMCSTACALLQYNATLHPGHLCRTAPSLALTAHAGYSHCLTSLCLSFAFLMITATFF